MAQIIQFRDVVRARARRRERALTACCLAIMEECLASTRHAYERAPAGERPARAAKVRQLEELIAYAAGLP